MKSAVFEVAFFLPTTTLARYLPWALMAVATVLICQAPLALAVVFNGVTFQTSPSKLSILTLPFAAGFICQ